MANSKCKECGCTCTRCLSSDRDFHLHVEIENLKQKLIERENHIVTMETNFLNEANKFPSGELVALRDEVFTWQDKYKRLYDAHRRVQRVNQGLEDKLLRLVDISETDKNTLTKDVATLSQKLAESNYVVKKLTDDNDRYKKDVSLAIQFLQCKQSNFVAHKFDSLPHEVQNQVAAFTSGKRVPPTEEPRRIPHEVKSIKVPIPTFPPTAMVYSVPKSPKPGTRRIDLDVEQPPRVNREAPPSSSQVDIVSAAIMAKVLEERQKEKAFAKHCDTCTCSKTFKIIYDEQQHTVGTQTDSDVVTVLANNNNNNNAVIKMLNCKESLKLPIVALTSAPSQPPTTSTNSIKFVVNNNNLGTKNSKVPINPNDSKEFNCCNNVVKVQPNNFLINKTQSIHENQINSQTDANLHQQHHRLCNNNNDDNFIMESNSAKNDLYSDNNLKGPRYCSMRLQSGTRNILLDNAHNNIAPVLYTRHQHNNNNNKLKQRISSETAKPHAISRPESCSSDDLHHRTATINNNNNNSLISDNSSKKNQQRVADWIQNNLDHDNDMNNCSSLDNSRSDDNYSSGDRVVMMANNNGGQTKGIVTKYAEMEENVKRFLFGESEFMKTVEIGKLKYQNYNRDDNIDSIEENGTKSSSHTETDI